MSIKTSHLLFLLLALLLAPCGFAHAATAPTAAPTLRSEATIPVAGAMVLAVSPQIFAVINDQSTPLAVKMMVPVAATVVSDAHGWAQLMFPDSSTISISADSELELLEFVDRPTEQSVLLNLASGTARVVTGDVSRRNPSAVRVKTPQATVGIRGTIVSIRVKNDVTSVFLTETSGLGVSVTDNTGASIHLTTPGHVLEVSPEGVKERPATPAEAQANNLAARGQSATTPENEAWAQTNENPLAPSHPLNTGSTSPHNAEGTPQQSQSTPSLSAGTPLPPVMDNNFPQTSLPESNKPTTSLPNTPGTGTNKPGTSNPGNAESDNPDITLPDTDFPGTGPTLPEFRVADIQGAFKGYVVQSGQTWGTSFNVNNARIHGADITRAGMPYAVSGSGTIANDASFRVDGFHTPNSLAPDTKTYMTGAFSSLNEGYFTIADGTNLHVNGSFANAARHISGEFVSSGNYNGDNWATIFNVNQQIIRDASFTIENNVRAANGHGKIAKDLSFYIDNFTGDDDWDDLKMNGHFTSQTGGMMNIKGDNIHVHDAPLRRN